MSNWVNLTLDVFKWDKSRKILIADQSDVPELANLINPPRIIWVKSMVTKRMVDFQFEGVVTNPTTNITLPERIWYYKPILHVNTVDELLIKETKSAITNSTLVI